ncbi:MAG: dihydrofolate reductase family protein [Bauldia sp.]
MTAAITGHVFIAASVDGFIARSDGDIAWLDRYAPGMEDHGYDAFMAGIDGLVMGRGTFEKVLTFGGWPFAKPVTVLSDTLREKDLRGDLAGKVRVSALAPREAMAKFAADGWRRVYVDGGKVIQSFLREGLIADMTVTRIPVLLGDGIPLFGSLPADVALRHVATRAFPSGLVQSTYAIGSPA